MMRYGWFVKLCTLISTSEKRMCVRTYGTEVSVYVGWLLIRGLSFYQAWVRGEGLRGV